MLFNKSENKNNRVKFVSYTGKSPNLCSGVLTLKIDGTQYKFGHNYMNHHFDEKKKNGFIQTKTNTTRTLILFGIAEEVAISQKITKTLWKQTNGTLMWKNFPKNSKNLPKK